MNGWKIIFIAVAWQSSIISFAEGNHAGSCFSSSFAKAIGYILRGFVIAEMKVNTVIECKRRCVISANCLSLNILTNADGSFLCQINSGVRENAASEQFVPHGAGEYYGLKEKKLCADSEKTCDSATPWHAFNQSYFKFVNVSLKLNFHDARKFCLGEKGDLASISSEEENTFVFKTFLENNPQAGGFSWIGLNDIAEEGKFVWSDDSPVTYTAFSGTEPDSGHGEEDCVMIAKDFAGVYGDAPCDWEQSFICETTYESLYN